MGLFYLTICPAAVPSFCIGKCKTSGLVLDKKKLFIWCLQGLRPALHCKGKVPELEVLENKKKKDMSPKRAQLDGFAFGRQSGSPGGPVVFALTERNHWAK
jgi:hypothetical protein